MKSLLFNLFDYQRFAQNKDLESVIENSGAKGVLKGAGKKVVPLSDELLASAAGGVSAENTGSKGTKAVQEMTVACQFCGRPIKVNILADRADCSYKDCGKTNYFSG